MLYRPSRRLLSNRRGATLALVALSTTMLLSIVALAVDLGMLFAARSEAQRAADSAALAGASAFLEHDPLEEGAMASQVAEDRAYEYGQMNTILRVPIVEEEIEPTILLNEAKVRVRITKQDVPLWFARIFGVQTMTVSAVSAAEAADAGSPTDCVKPFAIPDMWHETDDDVIANGIWDFDYNIDCNGNNCGREFWNYEPEEGDFYVHHDSAGVNEDPTGYGSDYRDGLANDHGDSYTKDNGRQVPIKINSGGSASEPSFYFPWAVDGRGASSFVEAIQQCIPLDVAMNQVVEGDGGEVESETGNMPMPTYQAIIDLIDNGYPDEGIAADPDATWDAEKGIVDSPRYGDNWRNSPRVMTVALFNPEDMRSGRTTMRFVNFAQIFLEDPRDHFTELNPEHKRPITARLIHYGSGANPAPESGSLIKVLRLVE